MTTITTVVADTFEQRLESAFGDGVLLGLIEQAEQDGLFPRELIARIGRDGIFASIWDGGPHPDMGTLVHLSERLGRLGSASAAAGISAHNAAIAMLRRFGKSDYPRDIADRAVSGEAIVCVGASESGGGSDLQSVTSTAEPTAAGYRVRGAKMFVSLAPVADVFVVVVRLASTEPGDGNVALFALQADQVRIGEPYSKLGAGYLNTAPIEFDVEVPADAMLARPGTGLAAVSVGLAIERLSVAGMVVGVCDLAIGVTVAQLMRRKQFGRPLFEHQALRLRFADLKARVDMLRYALKGLAGEGMVSTIRTAAGMKVTAARLGEEVMSECLHVFGGIGYLRGHAPVERWWRDMKLARVAAGVDEVLWELVAAGIRPDFEAHDRLVRA